MTSCSKTQGLPEATPPYRKESLFLSSKVLERAMKLCEAQSEHRRSLAASWPRVCWSSSASNFTCKMFFRLNWITRLFFFFLFFRAHRITRSIRIIERKILENEEITDTYRSVCRIFQFTCRKWYRSCSKWTGFVSSSIASGIDFTRDQPKGGNLFTLEPMKTTKKCCCKHSGWALARMFPSIAVAETKAKHVRY